MITGAHFVLYSKDADADRAFFRDVLNFRAVDAGGGWLIFALPPAELGVHPGDTEHSKLSADLYFLCDDLAAQMSSLQAKGVECSDVVEARWGKKTTFRLPGGGEVGLYQPSHPTAI